jgi:hypothetical protein
VGHACRAAAVGSRQRETGWRVREQTANCTGHSSAVAAGLPAARQRAHLHVPPRATGLTAGTLQSWCPCICGGTQAAAGSAGCCGGKLAAAPARATPVVAAAAAGVSAASWPHARAQQSPAAPLQRTLDDERAAMGALTASAPSAAIGCWLQPRKQRRRSGWRGGCRNYDPQEGSALL